MRHEFIYNGMNSFDYGLHTSGEDTWTRPQPDITRIQVPGRNGDLIQLGNRFQNVDITYHCGIIRDLAMNFDAFNAKLLTDPGYHRLEDSYHPEYFRMAVFESALDPDVKGRAVNGEVDIKFNCKPQMYLKSGEKEVYVRSTSIVLYNPTKYPAYPLIRFTPSSSTGDGYIQIGDNVMSWSDIGAGQVNSTIADCERQDIYGEAGRSNRNNYYTLESGEFFTLMPGRNVVRSSRVASLYITPRWWTV